MQSFPLEEMPWRKSIGKSRHGKIVCSGLQGQGMLSGPIEMLLDTLLGLGRVIWSPVGACGQWALYGRNLREEILYKLWRSCLAIGVSRIWPRS